jgi:hypothetical protein
MSGLVRFFYISSFLIISHHFSHHALFKKQVFPGGMSWFTLSKNFAKSMPTTFPKPSCIIPRLEHSCFALLLSETVSVLRESGGEYECDV